jgi:predicted DNA-binding protein
MLTLRLSPEVEKRLEKFALLSGQSKSSVARQAIIARIGDLEKAYGSRKRGKRVAKTPTDLKAS